MPRESPFTYAFTSPGEAVAALLSHVLPVEAEALPLNDAPRRILAQSITTDRPSPPSDVSSMDGYALRLADLTTTELAIAGEIRIGQAPPPLPPAVCLRIVTGAPIPPGADAVVKREDVTELQGRIVFPRPARIQSGQNIRRAAENLAAGAPVAPTGSPITPAIASALAAFGVAIPLVHRRVTIALLTTGDELVPVEAHPSPYQLRDSNSAALRALFQPLPFADVQHTHVPDDPAALRLAVAEALDSTDALILTGGVSMGHRDFVPDALGASSRVRINTLFHGLPQRPGKPILGAATHDGRPVLALPGNPVSVMVTARRIALPAILARAGGTKLESRPPLLLITNPDSKSIELWWHRLARITAPGHAELIDSRSSGDLVGAAQADGFIEIPPSQSGPGPWPFYSW